MRSRLSGPVGFRCGVIAAVVALALMAAATIPARAQVLSAEEESVKVAFLYNFMNFTQWPAAAFRSSEAPFVLCAISSPGFGRAADALAGKTLGGRPIVVRHLAWTDQARDCHLLYAEQPDSAAARRLLDSLSSASVLTVSDAEGFSEHGGMITLVKVNNRIAFAINVEVAARAGLKFSAKLLNLAKIVGE